MTSAEGGSAGTPANSGEGEGGVQATLFTQEQVNSIAAREKRGALGSFFKELGFDSVPDANTVKSVFDQAGEYKKLQDGQKGDLERLTGELNSTKETAAKVPTLETTILQQQIAGAEKLPVKFWKFVEGSTEDEIKDSIKELKQELDLDDGDGDEGDDGNQERQQQQGTGARPPKPNQQQGRTSGGGSPGKTLTSGADAYAKKHGKKE